MLEQNFKKTFLPLMDQWFRFSLAMVGSKEEAEDIVQEVLIKLWKRKRQMNDVKNIKAYSLQMVKNLSYDKMKKRKPVLSLEKYDYDSSLYTIEDKIFAKDEVVLIKNLIDKLTIRQKEIFVLKDIEGLSYDEVVEITNLDIRNVRATLSMARKRIKDLYAKIVSDGK
ncbi:sigma-70 family RNA polymerase sigma factor [Flavobacteriaceae bacterium AU392]|nr:RNA polymerase sigma factor [Flavobacteriaceae bacterium]RKM86002.1 sigma-70 family RNA polymerase sigma factor [Flavobacteriaceae bacterium AU392]